MYAARDERTGRPVALKLLAADLTGTPAHRQRLFAEGCLAASLDHPGICAIHEIGDAAGRAYVAMELLSGVTLDVYARQHPFDADRALDIAIQLTEALREAHEHDVVHRDLKSRNILVDADGRVKVLDFGLALRTRDDGPGGHGSRGPSVGTPDYASPEQIVGCEIDARSDLFSLGVVLHEMLTGRLPFQGENRTELFRAIVSNPALPVDQLNDAVPVGLSNVVGRLLAKDRERRYPSAAAVLAALRRVREKPAAPGARPGLTDSRWFHRIAGSAAGLLLAVGGLFPASVVLGIEAEAALRTTTAGQSGIWVGLATSRAFEPAVAAADQPAEVWIGNDGRLVYSTAVRGRAAVWTLAPGATTPRLVTAEGGSPAVAPSGDVLVFVGAADRALYRVALDGSRVERLADGPASAPRVLPDGRTVVFRDAAGVVRRMPVRGGAAEPLAGHRIGVVPLVSPDGRRIAFAQQDHTVVCDLPGCTHGRRLTVMGALAWTPDGLGLAFVGQPRGANVWVAPIDGGTARQVTWFSNRLVSGVAWSPDGRRLAVSRVMTLSDFELLPAFR